MAERPVKKRGKTVSYIEQQKCRKLKEYGEPT